MNDKCVKDSVVCQGNACYGYGGKGAGPNSCMDLGGCGGKSCDDGDSQTIKDVCIEVRKENVC